MPTMFASKGRFLVMAAGLLIITAYLGVALSWNGGLSISKASESKSEQTTNQTEDVITTVVEEIHLSNTNLANDVNALADSLEKPAVKSGASTVTEVQGKTGEDVIGITADTSDSTSTENARIVSHNNPLDRTIDPDIPGVAKAALTADFLSLVGSGMDVSTAVRYIDERVSEGKYGEELVRK